jgi:hypothetical protein
MSLANRDEGAPSLVLFALVALFAIGSILLGFLFYLGAHEYYPDDPWYYLRGPILMAAGVLLLLASAMLWSRSQWDAARNP